MAARLLVFFNITNMHNIPIPDDEVKISSDFIRVKLIHIISVLCLLIGISASAGGYRAAFLNQQDDVKIMKDEVKAVRQDLQQMHVDFAKLSQAMQDLQQTLSPDKKH